LATFDTHPFEHTADHGIAETLELIRAIVLFVLIAPFLVCLTFFWWARGDSDE
jgi:hypothetical protein